MTPLDSARSMLQLLLSNEPAPITRETIELKLQSVFQMSPQWRGSFDSGTLIDEVEGMFSIHVGTTNTLSDNSDHVEWLTAKRSALSWPFWTRYRTYVSGKLSAAAVSSLEETTDAVLQRLEDPKREGSWDRRGLVVGHVQSGKTGNYTGLICKAADAGYQVIVVLAGVHKSLRSQTQIRLDEGFLGYDSTPRTNGNYDLVGVGPLNPGLHPNTATNRHDLGDLSAAAQKNFGVHPGGNPLLFVVKKNVSVLNNLVKWAEFVAHGQPVVAGVPLLVVDDEADHASVDTKEQATDSAGNPDPDHNPTAINGCIRRFLQKFEKRAYVGYTATPFANIFIHEMGWTKDEGEDLFPRSFIVNLPAPSNYVGPVRVFGLDGDIPPDLEKSPSLPLVRHVSDFAASTEPTEQQGWMPPIHGVDHVPLYDGESTIPPSLRKAILSFLLACAARRARGQVGIHNSMLIHVTRLVEVQNQVHEQVKAELKNILLRLKLGEGAKPRNQTVLGELEDLWTQDFEPTQKRVAQNTAEHLKWPQVEAQLLPEAEKVQVRRINGSATDILDYTNNASTGISVIAVGGDKLSRGLTLEGLTVSYFLRASRMYDTLMQMGRWFGYRDGYLDLCRLYMPEELSEWFRHIAAASEELRVEFDRMAAIGATPREYGLKVRSHPALLVTSLVKMKHGTELQLSYEGGVSETVVFNREAGVLESNLATLEALLVALGPGEATPTAARPRGAAAKWDGSRRWQTASATEVCSFLRNIKTHPGARWVNGKLLASYIEKQRSRGELTTWTVALLGKPDGAMFTIGGSPIGLLHRAPEPNDPPFPDRYTIRRLLNPRDEGIDMDASQYEAAHARTKAAFHVDPGHSKRTEPPEQPAGWAYREQRPKESGLLLIYPLDWRGTNLEKQLPAIGFALSFPVSATAEKVVWQVNNVYWEMEAGQ